MSPPPQLQASHFCETLGSALGAGLEVGVRFVVKLGQLFHLGGSYFRQLERLGD